MNINYEDALQDETDELEHEIDSTEERYSPGQPDARRLVERRNSALREGVRAASGGDRRGKQRAAGSREGGEARSPASRPV